MALELQAARVAEALPDLQSALAATHQTVQLLLLQHSADADDGKLAKMRDTVWSCRNCGARLGVYNPDTDELRIRYKELVVYSTPGIGGSTRVPCRRCAEVNELRDTRTAARIDAKK